MPQFSGASDAKPDFLCGKCRGPVAVGPDPAYGAMARCGLCGKATPIRLASRKSTKKTAPTSHSEAGPGQTPGPAV